MGNSFCERGGLDIEEFFTFIEDLSLAGGLRLHPISIVWTLEDEAVASREDSSLQVDENHSIVETSLILKPLGDSSLLLKVWLGDTRFCWFLEQLPRTREVPPSTSW